MAKSSCGGFTNPTHQLPQMKLKTRKLLQEEEEEEEGMVRK
jgi:hypothetical protein